MTTIVESMRSNVKCLSSREFQDRIARFIGVTGIYVTHIASISVLYPQTAYLCKNTGEIVYKDHPVVVELRRNYQDIIDMYFKMIVLEGK